jgi:hypothetical protein
MRLAHGRERKEMEENIKVDINRVSFGNGNWIKLAQSLVQLWAFLLKTH